MEHCLIGTENLLVFERSVDIRDTVEAEARAVFDKISMEQLIENARLAAEIAANPPPGFAQEQLTLNQPKAARA
jgi:hypothetical protein